MCGALLVVVTGVSPSVSGAERLPTRVGAASLFFGEMSVEVRGPFLSWVICLSVVELSGLLMKPG